MVSVYEETVCMVWIVCLCDIRMCKDSVYCVYIFDGNVCDAAYGVTDCLAFMVSLLSVHGVVAS